MRFISNLLNNLDQRFQSNIPDVSFEGPDDEETYELTSGDMSNREFDRMAISVTNTVLTLHRRSAEEIYIRGVTEMLQDENRESYETLLNSSGDLQFNRGDAVSGKIPATPETVSATLDLYTPGLLQATFIDENERAISSRYDATYQYYWLDNDTFHKLADKADEQTVDRLG